MPQIESNIGEFRALLERPDLGNFPPQNVITIPPDADYRHVGETIHRVGKEATDLFLFYYAGHGMLSESNGELVLGLAGTSPDPLIMTGLPLSPLQEVISASHAHNRAFILDCCYSGRAAAANLSSPDDEQVLGQVDIKGTLTLASSPSNRVSIVVQDERFTAFTGRLLTILETGLQDAHEWLTFRVIFEALHERMLSEGLPRPQRLGTDRIEDLGIMRNLAWQPRQPMTTLLLENLNRSEVARLVEDVRGLISGNVSAGAAAPILRKAAREAYAKLGARHPHTVELHFLLALTLWKLAHREEATDLLREVFAIRTEQLGSGHPATLQAGYRLAGILGDTGWRREAVALWEELIKSHTATYGKDAPETLKCRYWLGVNLGVRGEVRRANQIFDAVEERQSLVLGEAHTDVAETQNSRRALWVQENADRLMEIHAISQSYEDYILPSEEQAQYRAW